MADVTEFHSVWPMISGRVLKRQNPRVKIYQKFRPDNAEKEVQLLREDLAFNTNAKTTPSSPDRLKKLFADRQSHRNLSEQKVSDWLLRYRSYTHIPPKDMTDVPENIWAPLDIDHSSKNNAASDLGSSKYHKEVADLRNKRRVLNSTKGRPSKSPSKCQALRVMRRNITDGKGHQAYFFEPPYRRVDVAYQTIGGTDKPLTLRKFEDYMNVSRGLLKGSRLMS